MTLLVVSVPLLFALIWWSVVVLNDESLYVDAVAPLGHSAVFAKVSGRLVQLSMQHRCRRTRLIGRRTARYMGSITRWSMRTRPFAASWPIAQRMLHRHRCAHRAGATGTRVAIAMVSLATMGMTVRASRCMIRRTRDLVSSR